MGLSSHLSFETLREKSHGFSPEKIVLPQLIAITKVTWLLTPEDCITSTYRCN
jgi:hypothetical protein